jgi:hypothetical protein
MKKILCTALIALLVVVCSTAPSGAAAPKKYFYGPCDFDLKIPKEWSALQTYMSAMNECLGPVKVVPASMPKATPKTAISAENQLGPLGNCKIQNPAGQGQTKAFPNPSQMEMASWRTHPGPNTVIQVVPISAPDAKVQPGSTPQKDYGRYFKFLTDYMNYASDGPSKFQIRVPDEYIEFPKALSDYTITHHATPEQMEKQRPLGQEIVSAADSKIDFTGANMVLVVVPAETKFNVMEQAALGSATADGNRLNLISFAEQYTLKDKILDNRGFMAPMWWLHELYHIGIGLADHNGSNYWQNYRPTDPNEPGMGNWGLMSMSKTELTSWEKWLVGFNLDSQVRCVKTSLATTHWLAPAAVKTTKPKLAVIPISASKVVVVESIRAAGLNYMLPKLSEGALVYEVDTSATESEYGFKVISGSKAPISRSPFILSDAPLKRGQSVTVEGIKITNVEWGDFGDVIKVEPVK